MLQVYKSSNRLQQPRTESSPSSVPSDTQMQRPKRSFLRIPKSIKVYFTSPALLPSLALSLLYLTVLSFNSQMSTFLLLSGYTPTSLGVLRSVSIIFEISATWLGPCLISWIGPVRAGLWSVNWQMTILLTGVSLFWHLSVFSSVSEPLSIAPLLLSVILSRVGLWSFDLSVQLLVQDLVAAPYRGSFSTSEAALHNLFEMLAFASTLIWRRPDQFRYPAALSLGPTMCAAISFAAFVRRERGHLTHLNHCLRHGEKKRTGWDREEAGEEGEALILEEHGRRSTDVAGS